MNFFSARKLIGEEANEELGDGPKKFDDGG
jgi:hypothetical protein